MAKGILDPILNNGNVSAVQYSGCTYQGKHWGIISAITRLDRAIVSMYLFIYTILSSLDCDVIKSGESQCNKWHNTT